MTYVDQPSNAASALNSYLWKLLEANLGWSKADYGGISPITPNQQQPELLQSGNPFIVYGSAIYGPGHLYQVRAESMAYSIYGMLPSQVDAVCNLLADCFERQDEAAADVNQWLGAEGRNRGISFTTIKLSMVERAVPPEEEGGMTTGLVILEFRYIQNTTKGAQFSGFTP